MKEFEFEWTTTATTTRVTVPSVPHSAPYRLRTPPGVEAVVAASGKRWAVHSKPRLDIHLYTPPTQ